MEVPVEVYRAGRSMKLTTVIGDREASLSALAGQTSPETDFTDVWLGMELTTFTPELAREIGARHIDGVYVVRVYPGTPADRASIADGTVLIEVNNTAVSSLADVRRIAGEIGNSRQRIPLIVQEPDGTIARKICRL
jgi:C-terminal processing protease CtpA/Prc